MENKGVRLNQVLSGLLKYLASLSNLRIAGSTPNCAREKAVTTAQVVENVKPRCTPRPGPQRIHAHPTSSDERVVEAEGLCTEEKERKEKERELTAIWEHTLAGQSASDRNDYSPESEAPAGAPKGRPTLFHQQKQKHAKTGQDPRVMAYQTSGVKLSRQTENTNGLKVKAFIISKLIITGYRHEMKKQFSSKARYLEQEVLSHSSIRRLELWRLIRLRCRSVHQARTPPCPSLVVLEWRLPPGTTFMDVRAIDPPLAWANLHESKKYLALRSSDSQVVPLCNSQKHGQTQPLSYQANCQRVILALVKNGAIFGSSFPYSSAKQQFNRGVWGLNICAKFTSFNIHAYFSG
ncbi:uncharacterized protein BDR25DRAFT_355456 [Lindgomyces ingoldianus]|uniref:Uncharacterized protein n=1 Tax=Lindgomyces ingoldianus TaxID=673940 RepID=A0ACB6QU08_9PLEO|nr:uncharacterized protein BDR25DRAFT_355456 [Lindgomyces ingoldianus]KAF2470342.1 hypothetical protein BDR25DRAFT_355456 [Lindgomyces ingoldianus]